MRIMLIEKPRETKFPVTFLKFLKFLETFSKKFPKKEKFLKFLETFFKKFLSGVLRGKAPKLLLLNKIKIR